MNAPSVYVVFPKTKRAKEWAAEHLPEPTWSLDGIVVEHRYIQDIVEGIRGDGMTAGLCDPSCDFEVIQ